MLWQTTRTPLNRQTQNTQGECRVTCVLAGLRAHYTTPAIPKQEEEEERRRKKKEKKE